MTSQGLLPPAPWDTQCYLPPLTAAALEPDGFWSCFQREQPRITRIRPERLCFSAYHSLSSTNCLSAAHSQPDPVRPWLGAWQGAERTPKRGSMRGVLRRDHCPGLEDRGVQRNGVMGKQPVAATAGAVLPHHAGGPWKESVALLPGASQGGKGYTGPSLLLPLRRQKNGNWRYRLWRMFSLLFYQLLPAKQPEASSEGHLCCSHQQSPRFAASPRSPWLEARCLHPDSAGSLALADTRVPPSGPGTQGFQI